MSGNSVILVNSTSGRHLTVGDLLLVSRRARGHLRLRAGVEKAAAWLLRPSWPHFKASNVAILLRFLPLLFPSPPCCSGEHAPSPKRILASAKPVIAPPVLCEPSRTALVA